MQLECKEMWTIIRTHVPNMHEYLYDFISQGIINHRFLWVWMYGDDNNLWWHIYSEATRHEETTVQELVYHSPWDLIYLMDWLDDTPEYQDKPSFTQLSWWLLFLIQEDFIPSHF